MQTPMNADKEFVEEYRPLVVSIAHKVRAQFELDIDLDDLQAYGFTGLIEAKGRFDPERGVKFNTFAYYRIRGAMLDGVRKAGYLPARAYARLKAAQAALEIGESVAETYAANPKRSSGQAPDRAQTLNQVHDTLTKLTASFTIAAVGQSGEDTDSRRAETQLLERERRDELKQAMTQLPEREYALIHGFYFEGRRFDEVAAELGISKSWASRLHSKALKSLRKALTS